MIFFIFGQPGSGKTTIGKELLRRVGGIQLDGDDLRAVFHDTDYTPTGREKNIERAMDIALWERSRYETVIVSMVCPYNIQRAKFDRKADIFWVYLNYSTDRGKESFRVPEFEIPDGLTNCIHLITDGSDGPISCVDRILAAVKEI